MKDQQHLPIPYQAISSHDMAISGPLHSLGRCGTWTLLAVWRPTLAIPNGPWPNFIILELKAFETEHICAQFVLKSSKSKLPAETIVTKCD